MSLQLNNIKKRIKSVNGAYKVTSAMKLVSTVRLRKYKNTMLANKNYMEEMGFVTRLVLEHAKKATSAYTLYNIKAEKNLYIILSSTLGLCGSYNQNVFHVAESKISEKDDAIILGKKAALYFKNGKFTKIDGFSEYTNLANDALVKDIVSYIDKTYLNGEYKEVHLIYTEYKNSLVFLAKDYLLLPLIHPEDKEKEEEEKIILEPSPKELVDTLTPLYLKNEIFSKLLESEVCEQAARCNAMDNATENAKEILDNLQIEFNKARQASITQEITEIVSAANSL